MAGQKLDRRSVVGGLSALTGFAAAGRAAGAARRPNIVFFMGEGLRADEFGFMGAPLLKTPNMDRLARTGTVFRNAFVTNALCLPSRATFLTGAYSHTTGATTNEEATLPISFPVVTDLLRQSGYETAFIGKSHVSGALLDHPWDYYFGFRGQADYLNPVVTERTGEGGATTRVYRNTYVDDLLTDRATAWLEGRTGDKPFCLFLWFYAPHAPFYRPRRMLTRFNGMKVPVPKDFDEDLTNYEGKPRAVAEATNKIGTTRVFSDMPRSLEELVKDHYAGVEANDESVGQVMGVLERKGMADDTLVMLSSDHGFFLGEHTFYDKRLMYEPSIRVPMILRLPGRVRAGQVRNEMVLNVDAAPTLLEFAGLPVPSQMQGRSFAGLAAGRPAPDWRKDWLYEYYEYPGYENVRPNRGVRTERYKLIHYFLDPEEFELYDLATDPGEDHNLYGRPGMEALTAQLKARLTALRAETGDAYVYKPSRSPRPSIAFDPPTTVPQPWRPQSVEPRR
ncbi:MAG: sulfatase-like hydrolase/transferase [Phenylobacterium sp.]|uniref:sulfatase family protein n=1 Tax=Phenylobacterium sp. TaxID=1871053 RepID=UPI0025F9E297|nr:sulfatase [Phenylobacterium sp.]MBI1197551.1 sulfatase-like hydrolase/transferase [Phenylobacterium sp.]